MIQAMIVDDEPAVASIIRHFIEKNSLPIEIVEVATNGKQAVDGIRRNKPQLVFLDICMPMMNGFDVMETEPDIHYIIITANESFGYAQQALRLGAKDILLKPIVYSEFMQAITRAIGWKFTGNSTINGILEYINANYAQKIELSQLAAIFYATPSHIARLFKKHMDMSIITYVHQVRIENAVRMLDTGQYNIKMVAEMVGYESLNNFYKYFKQYVGITPAAYCKKIGHTGDAPEVKNE